MMELVLRRQRRFRIAGKASNGCDGLRKFREVRPDLVITELLLPEMDGADFIAAIREEEPEIRIVIYTAAANCDLLVGGFKAQAQGFAHKAESFSELQKATRIVADGGEYFSPEAQRLRQETDMPSSPESSLTIRETEVLKLIAASVNTKQIAEQLSISTKTVENYRVQFARKLGLRDVAALTRYAVRNRLVGVDDMHFG